MFHPLAFARKSLHLMLAFLSSSFRFMKRYGFLIYAITMSIIVSILVVGSATQSASFRSATYEPSIVEIVAPNGSGTGFRFSYNGKQYIGTASHVCSSVKTLTPTIQYRGQTAVTKILASSTSQDVCILENTIEGPALYLDISNPSFAQDVFTIGYSGSTGLTYNEGHVSQRVPGMLPLPISPDDIFVCMAGGGIPYLSGGMSFCNKPAAFLASTVTIFRGQSGSPLLNSKGEVVGIASQMTYNGSLWSESKYLAKLAEGLK